MSEQGLSNADLVKASTDQLNFKTVQKGRKGRRLTPHNQEKILAALLKAKPDLKIRRRDLFRYELPQESVEQILDAMELIGHKKIKYPQFIDLLMAAGINRYAVEVGSNRITFYGAGGEAHVEEGAPLREQEPGAYNEPALRAAIADAQREAIDHATFLRRILQAGITAYEANIRNRRIHYRGEAQSYHEDIPAAEPIGAPPAAAKPAPDKAAPKKPAKSGKAKADKKSIRVKNSIKARIAKKALKYKRSPRRKAKSRRKA